MHAEDLLSFPRKLNLTAVNLYEINSGHFQASAMRISAVDGPILVMQGTTKFSFKRVAPEKIGFIREVGSGCKAKDRRPSRVMLIIRLAGRLPSRTSGA